MDYKIFSYLDKVIEQYQEPVSIVDGLVHNPKEVLRTIEFYSNNEYTSGKTDALGREKPFFNAGNYRVTTSKVGTDIDLKDMVYTPESLNDAIPAMLINHEQFKYLKEINFSKTLNETGFARPKYGHFLIKRIKEKDGVRIDIVDLKNVDFDPVDMLEGLLIETHWKQPSEVAENAEVWYEVDEFLKAHAKANKGKPARMEIKEITGVMPVSFDPDVEENEENDRKFKTYCFYIGVVNKKKFYLYKEELKDIREKYRCLAWERIPGRALGRGVIEEGFEAQVWINDAMISIKNAMDVSTKVVGISTSQKVSGNSITGVDHGHIFELEPNATLDFRTLSNVALPQFEKVIELWNSQYDRVASTYDANTGEAPTAGTPYSQTALLNQVANSPLEYRREEAGIFWNEILNDWVLPEVKRRIKKPHYLVSEFSAEELEMIDKDIKTKYSNENIKEMFLQNKIPTPQDQEAFEEFGQEGLKGFGAKREVEIPEGYLDIEGRITANITGEAKNKAVMIQSIDTLMQRIISTFDPNTGTYRLLEDPTLRKLTGQIVEMSGIPFSSAQLKPTPASAPMPTQSADLSAITPQNAQTPAI